MALRRQLLPPRRLRLRHAEVGEFGSGVFDRRSLAVTAGFRVALRTLPLVLLHLPQKLAGAGPPRDQAGRRGRVPGSVFKVGTRGYRRPEIQSRKASCSDAEARFHDLMRLRRPMEVRWLVVLWA